MPAWARLDLSRVRALGAERRHAMANAAGSISDLLEVFARTGPEMAELVGVLQEGLAVLFAEAGLEGAMGQTETDNYGVLRDVELGKPVGYALAWSREEPRLRVRVHLTRAQALDIEVRVDLHRALGRTVAVPDLLDLLGVEIYEQVLAGTAGREQEAMLALLARALEVQSADRVEVLSALMEQRAAKG